MSDAQPRKRKNKAKKKDGAPEFRPELIVKERPGPRKSKDDSADEDIFSPLKQSSDEVIHVHKDATLGGNLITKLIFFGVLASIGVMVGVILLEYRGTSDEETISAVDSPWSVTLEDWVDKEAQSHGAHGEEEPLDEIEDHDEHLHEEEEEIEEDEGIGDDDEVPPDERGSDGVRSWFASDNDDQGDSGEVEVLEQEGGILDSVLSLFKSESIVKEQDEIPEDDDDEATKEEGGGWFGFGRSSKDLDEEEHEELQEDERESQEVADDLNEEDEDTIEDEREEEDEENDEEKYEDESEEIIDQLLEREDEDEENEEPDEHEWNRKEDDEENEDIEESPSFDRLIDEEEPEEEEEEDFEKDALPDLQDDEENVSSELNHPEENDDEGFDENVSKEDAGNEDSQEEVVEPNVGEPEDKFEEELNEEDLFPEAREALRLEREAALVKEAKEKAAEQSMPEEPDEGYSESSDPSQPEGDETEGMALKFGVGVAFIVVAHVVLVKKWNSWATEEGGAAAPDDSSSLSSPQEAELEKSEEVRTDMPPVSQSPPPVVASPPPAPPASVWPSSGLEPSSLSPSHSEPAQLPPSPPPPPDEDSEPEEVSTGEPDEEGEEEEDESEVDIDREKFKELIAKYGQETSESSDIEPSDDDLNKANYSEGEESGGDEESPAEELSDEPPASEDEMKEWTGLKKSDLEKITRLESDGSEGEDEEEDEEVSEDEPAAGPTPSGHQRGGPNDQSETYPNDLITNEEDWAIREELDAADAEFNYEKAHTLFSRILSGHPNSARARSGLARSLDQLAEVRRSNKLLQLAIESYQHALTAPNIPDNLFISVASRLINRLRFRGLYPKAIEVHKQLIQRFASTPEYRNDMAISYLMMNDLENARLVLKEVLNTWSEDPTALAHYGLVLKLQGNIHGCIKYLEKGLASDFTATKDSRLYFHLGDALARVGRESDAIKVYDKAVSYGLFRSRYQRSLYNVDHLTARPWWTLEETTYSTFFKLLEENWLQIREEGEKALKLNGLYKDEAENLRDKGDWKQFELFARGSEIKSNCGRTPLTCGLIRSFGPAAGCKRGQSKFSLMEGGTHVWAHCGPTNCRLRAHLGLRVPPGPALRVANITRTWKEGEVIVFDDSFEHEVWHNGTSLRLVLIVDVWHPELTSQEKASLSPI